MQQTAQIIEMAPVGGMLIEYPVTDSAIAELARRFTPLEITDTQSYKKVQAAISKVRGYRVSVEKKRKELKKDALEYGRKVDGEAKRIVALLEPIEEELKAKKKVVDDVKAAEAARIAKVEADRISGIRKRIFDIQRVAIGLNDLDVKSLENLFMQVEDEGLLIDEYAEFANEAKQVIGDTSAILSQAISVRKRLDEEAAAQKVEAERLEKIRVEQERERRKIEEETARVEAERKVEEARIAEAQAKLDAEKRKIQEEKDALEAAKQAEIARVEREILEKRLAEEAKVKAEKEAQEKAKRDEITRIAREEAELKEIARQEALKPDKEKLESWARRLLDMTAASVTADDAIAIAEDALDKAYETAEWVLEKTSEL